MEIIAQRGDFTFLVQQGSVYYLVNTASKEKWEVDSPDQVFRHGYCIEPKPTDDQREILNELLKSR